MCGLVVVINLCRQEAVTISEQMADKLAHRGPDDRGNTFIPWVEEEPDGPGISFSHRRLAVLDLSLAGHQPMVDADKRLVIAYNGEIYNHLECRSSLLADLCFRSTCDTETLLELWKRYGSRTLEQLRGIFAFVLFDRKTKRVHVVRDRLGIKPLYWASIRGNSSLVIASEVKAFLAGDFFPRRFSHDAVESFLAHGSVVGPLTIHRDVEEIPPASHWVILPDATIISKTRYWSWPSVDPRLTDVEAIRSCRGLLASSVSENLLSDAPLGIFSSGGMDSAAVGALIRQATIDQVIKSITLDFQAPGFLADGTAKLSASSIRAEHHSVPIGEKFFFEQFRLALDAWDQPSKDGLNTYLISKVARSLGLTVVVSGLGGDEVFCGYDFFWRLPSSYRTWSRFKIVPAGIRRLLGRIASQLNDRRAQKLAGLFDDPSDVIRFYLVRRQHFMPKERALLGFGETKNLFGIPRSLYEHLISSTDAKYPLHAMGTADIHVPMINTLLRDSDCMSMAHSLELRVPLLDHRIVELNYRLADCHRVNEAVPKRILYESVKELLPQEIVFQEKRGFEVPTRQWLSAPDVWPMIQAVLAPGRLRALRVEGVKRFANGGARRDSRGYDFLWMLFILERYLQHNDFTE